MSKDKTDIWMPLYIGDYLADTMELDATEHGAYLLLIMHYWRTQKPLPLDLRLISKIARIKPSRTSNAVRNTVIGYFRKDVNGYVHPRIELELEKNRLKKEKAKQNGELGGNPSFKQGQPNPYYKDNPKVISQVISQDTQKINSSKSQSHIKKEVSKDTSKKVWFINLEKVKLTKEQHESLVAQFGHAETQKFITNCEDYCKSKGITYKDYAATMRTWERKNNSKPTQQPMFQRPLSVTEHNEKFFKEMENKYKNDDTTTDPTAIEVPFERIPNA